MDELMLKIDNVSKQYKLGQIGGTTLRDELQRLRAKRRGEEDPTKRIGAKDYNKGETFMALDGVSFEVKKGERVGIIGHNGAGKSTLLKLISRVTAPTSGTIGMNGRVASMLEVGTGFHQELTGRENIYMNGAILGMTKKEIDAKMEDIIEFSECRQFIDTPVKRYSSGMYVKLAFSVAAHLDSEIMIMDEVLAVGDINFQQKCLKKMKSAALDEGKTILYVSHNMSTIQALCNRCIVLEKGKMIYDGNVNEAISIYSNKLKQNYQESSNVMHFYREEGLRKECLFEEITTSTPVINLHDKYKFTIRVNSNLKMNNCFIRMIVKANYSNAIGTCYTETFNIEQGISYLNFELDTSEFTNGDYILSFVLCEYTDGCQIRQDYIDEAISFHIEESEYYYNFAWDHFSWGYFALNALKKTN